MNFVADEGIDAPIVHRLRADGHTVWYVAEISPSIADETILTRAHAENAILITADKDFGALVFQQRRASAGVVLLRLAGLPPRAKADLVGEMVLTHGERFNGAFTVITPHRVRIRPTP